jgi:hypothetical protein
LSLRAHLLLLIALVIVPPIAVQMAGAGASAFGLGALTLSLLPGAVAIWCFGIYGIARPRQRLLAAVTLWTQDDWAARVELDRVEQRAEPTKLRHPAIELDPCRPIVLGP